MRRHVKSCVGVRRTQHAPYRSQLHQMPWFHSNFTDQASAFAIKRRERLQTGQFSGHDCARTGGLDRLSGNVGFERLPRLRVIRLAEGASDTEAGKLCGHRQLRAGH